MSVTLENLTVATGLEKISFHSNPKERQCQKMFKLPHSHARKVMLKILQASLQQYMNLELPDVQTGFKKIEEAEIKLQTPTGSLRKQESSREKKIYFCFIDYAKAFDCVNHNKLWKIFQEMGITC